MDTGEYYEVFMKICSEMDTEKDAKRYRFLRSLSLDPKKGLEWFVVEHQMDYVGDDADWFDRIVDRAMEKASE